MKTHNYDDIHPGKNEDTVILKTEPYTVISAEMPSQRNYHMSVDL